MTPRERVLTALAHERPDRVPVDFKARNDVTDSLQDHTGSRSREELHRLLGIDLRNIGVRERHEGFLGKTNGVLGGSSQKSGGRYVFHRDGTYEDAWGVRYRPGRDGLYDEWVDGPFARSQDLDAFTWPDPAALYDSVEAIAGRVAALEGEFATAGNLVYPIRLCWQMRGLENFLCDMLVDPDFARELWRRNARYELEKALRLARAGVDIVAFYGDIAMQDRMLVSPAAWRAVDKPLFAGMIQEIKAAAPEVRVMYHSDGDVSEVIPDLIEIGVEILNPIQPESMDPAEIKRRFGSRLVLHGCVSIQRTLPFGSRADVAREIRHLVDVCGRDGGLIVCPSNHVQPDTPLANVLEIYRAAGSLRGE